MYGPRPWDHRGGLRISSFLKNFKGYSEDWSSQRRKSHLFICPEPCSYDFDGNNATHAMPHRLKNATNAINCHNRL